MARGARTFPGISRSLKSCNVLSRLVRLLSSFAKVFQRFSRHEYGIRFMAFSPGVERFTVTTNHRTER